MAKGKKATKRTRGSVWMGTRERILARDNRLCRCSECITAENPLVATQVDHVIPLIDGGEDNDDNLQSLNVDCHKRKTAAEAGQRAASQFSIPACAPSPLEFLLAVMNDETQEPRLRVRAAVAAAQYKHTKTHDGGKKEGRDDAAKVASQGKFAPSAPPKLVVNNLK